MYMICVQLSADLERGRDQSITPDNQQLFSTCNEIWSWVQGFYTVRSRKNIWESVWSRIFTAVCMTRCLTYDHAKTPEKHPLSTVNRLSSRRSTIIVALLRSSRLLPYKHLVHHYLFTPAPLNLSPLCVYQRLRLRQRNLAGVPLLDGAIHLLSFHRLSSGLVRVTTRHGVRRCNTIVSWRVSTVQYGPHHQQCSV